MTRQDESLRYEHQKHSGELPLVGINTFLNPHPQEAKTQSRFRALPRKKKLSAGPIARLPNAPRHGGAHITGAPEADRYRGRQYLRVANGRGGTLLFGADYAGLV